ncbi:MAG TPA: hypothetical protein VFD76_02890 [Gemmatimonadales bacterium]|jgi:hypothetical protein|nr:hypothetical protein [Gemmatimonadales bacterium]
MADKTLEKLRSLLKTYDERSAKAQGAAKPTLDEGERRRRTCGGRLQTVVRAVLQTFAIELRNSGHQASVEDHTDTADAYPSVSLSFTPRTAAGTALASMLAFKCDPRRGIAVARDVRVPTAKGRVVSTSTDRLGTMKVEAVTPEWAETKALSFIEEVLKAN